MQKKESVTGKHSAALVGKVAAKVRTASTREIPYQKWIVRHLPGPKELERQRREKFDFQPKISIVIPLYKTQEKYLRQLVETIKEQTYPNWELCQMEVGQIHQSLVCLNHLQHRMSGLK